LTAREAPVTPALALEVRNLFASYGKRQVLSDVSIQVRKGEAVAVLGHNGAGKTTLLKSILGIHHADRGEVAHFGRDAAHEAYHRNVAAGISFTPADSPVFRPLSVETNLRLGCYSTAPDDVDSRVEEIFGRFPKLRQRRDQFAGTLSGGEQRMLAVGMAFMNRPNLLLLDEPTIGLAPATAQEILRQVTEMCRDLGLSVLLVDQNVRSTIRYAGRVYFLRMGKIILEETSAQAAKRDHYWDLF